jgi:hypothetical protein
MSLIKHPKPSYVYEIKLNCLSCYKVILLQGVLVMNFHFLYYMGLSLDT